MPRWLLKSCVLLAASLAVLASVAALSQAQRVDAGSEGKRILSIDLQTKSEGKVFDRAPESSRKHEILGNLRTRLSRAFAEADLKADRRYLKEVSHMFRDVGTDVSLSTEPEGVRVKLILTQPLVAKVRFMGWLRGEDDVRDAHRFLGSVDTAEGAEFSLRRLDADVKRLFDSGAFLDVRGEHKYMPNGVDVVFRVVQSGPLATLAFSGVYATGYTGDLQKVIAGREPVRADGEGGGDTLVAPAYFPEDAFEGDVVTDASAANILGAREQIRAFYRARGYHFVEVTPRVMELPQTFNAAEITRIYGKMRTAMLSTVRGLIGDGYGGKTVLIFDVFEGEKLNVGEVIFKGIGEVESPGTDALSIDRISGFFRVVYQVWYGVFANNADRKAAVLSEVMRLKAGSAFVESDAVRDAESVQAYMQQRGWLDARVSFNNFEFNNVRSRVNVVFHVDPGAVYAASDLRIEYATRAPRVPQGVEPSEFDAPAITFEQLLDELDIDAVPLDPAAAEQRYTAAYIAALQRPAEGKHFGAYDLESPLPWDEFQLSGAIGVGEGLEGKIRTLLAEEGYSNIEISFERVETEAEYLQTDWTSPWPVRKVGMILRIQQGYKSIVGNVTFRGNTETRDDVVRRLVSLYPGDVFDRNRQRASDMRLRRTQWFEQGAPGQGVLSRVSPRPVVRDGNYIEYTDIDYDLVEGRTNQINFAAGFSTGTGFTASIDLTFANFDIASLINWTWGEFSSFSGAGQRLSFRAQPPLDRQQIYSISFTEPYLFGYPLSGGISGSYQSLDRISYTETRLGIDPFIGWNIVPDVHWTFGYSYAIEGLIDIAASAPPEIKEDEGEEILSKVWSEIAWITTDNPQFPTRGFELKYRLEYAGGLFQGTLDFWRMRAEASYYIPVAEIDPIRHLVLALTATATWQDVHSGAEQIPFRQRLLLGGNQLGTRGTLRGFEFSGVGPSRNDQAIGGNFMIHGSAELRFPIFPGSLWIVGFVDFGELSPTLNTFDPLGWTVSGGVGLRLLLPILPVPFALDFGFPIINQPGNREQVVSINLGFGF